jgi:Uma2 family endonuclease
MTFEEFLAWEQGQESRWEFVNGEVFAMTGGTAGHERVARALTRLIEKNLPAGCEVFAANMKVRVREEPEDSGRYPDVVVTCEWPDDEALYLTEPLLIAEVLSPSTEGVDRGGKFTYYRLIQTLREYLLVDGRRRTVEVYRRQGAEWHMHACCGSETVVIETLGMAFFVGDLFGGDAIAR